MDSKQCIFGIGPMPLPGQTVKLINIKLYAARLSILQVWLEVHPPTISMWYDKILSILPYERLSRAARNPGGFCQRVVHPLTILVVSGQQ